MPLVHLCSHEALLASPGAPGPQPQPRVGGGGGVGAQASPLPASWEWVAGEMCVQGWSRTP